MGRPSEVDEIFDAISYSKGASVIRMLHEYIGDAVSTSSCNGLVNSRTSHAYVILLVLVLSTYKSYISDFMSTNVVQ